MWRLGGGNGKIEVNFLRPFFSIFPVEILWTTEKKLLMYCQYFLFRTGEILLNTRWACCRHVSAPRRIPSLHEGNICRALIASHQLHASCCPFDLMWLTFPPPPQTTVTHVPKHWVKSYLFQYIGRWRKKDQKEVGQKLHRCLWGNLWISLRT